MDGADAISVAWFVLTTLACALCWTPPLRRRLARRRHPVLLAVAVAVLARAVPAILPLSTDAIVSYDLHSYRAVADAVARHTDVYDLTGRYPYLPLHMYAFAVAGWLAAHTPLPFALLVKLPAIAADATLTALVGRAAAGLGRRDDTAALAMVFALNPVSVLVTGYHGQFDAVPTALLFGAWTCVAFGSGRRWRVLSALLLGLAVADKTWPLLLTPVLLWRVRGLAARTMYLALAAIPPLTCLAFYEQLVPGGAVHALRTVATYQGVVGTWGFSALLVRAAGAEGHEAALHAATTLGPWVLAGALACAYATAARLRHDAERFAVILGMLYAAASGWGVHWLAWLVPAAVLGAGRWSAVYLAAAGAYSAAIYLAFRGVIWGFAWFTNSLAPATWPATIGLALWAALAGTVSGACIVTLLCEAGALLGRTGRALRALALSAQAATVRTLGRTPVPDPPANLP